MEVYRGLADLPTFVIITHCCALSQQAAMEPQ